MLTLDNPTTATERHPADEANRATTRARNAALLVVGVLAGFLPLNVYWALGGTWGIGWVLGCAGCTVPKGSSLCRQP